jgi:hypothetical protein
MIKSTAAIVATLTLAGAAQASSEAAWRQFDAQVRRSCATASGLGSARVSPVIGFDDSLGKVAVLVSGTQQVETRAGQRALPVRTLCIYDQRSKKTWTSEASGWSAPVTAVR